MENGASLGVHGEGSGRGEWIARSPAAAFTVIERVGGKEEEGKQRNGDQIWISVL